MKTHIFNEFKFQVERLKLCNFVTFVMRILFYFSQTFFHVFIFYTCLICYGHHSYNEFYIFTKVCMKHSTFFH